MTNPHRPATSGRPSRVTSRPTASISKKATAGTQVSRIRSRIIRYNGLMPRIAVGLLLACTTVFVGVAAAQEPPPVAQVPPVTTQIPFDQWIAPFRAEALGHGIRPQILDEPLNGLH